MYSFALVLSSGAHLNPDEKTKVIDPSFTSTELMESLSTLRKKAEILEESYHPSNASALSTAELAELTSRRGAAPLWRSTREAMKTFWARLKHLKFPRWRLAAAGALFAFAMIATIGSMAGRSKSPVTKSAEPLSKWLAQLSETDRSALQTWLSHGDRVSAWIYLRGLRGEEKTVPAILVTRAMLAAELRDSLDALDALEQAVKALPSIAEEPIYVHAAVQTFAAGRVTRTQALLGHVSRDLAIKELSVASTDWSFRVRHGASDLLKAYGKSVPDEVAVTLLDLWQAENCDSKRAIAGRLLAKGDDPRIGPAIEAAARRDDGCLSNLTARARAARH